MSQATRARPPRARRRGTQYYKDVCGEAGRTTSRAASRSLELCRACPPTGGFSTKNKNMPQRCPKKVKQYC
eukprot:3918520-Pyramimonas_sp.AAC.1